MAALQEILASFKKVASSETNGTRTTAPMEIPRDDETRKAWQQLIDQGLIEWGRHPEQFEDEDGYKVPTADNLVRATEFILFCRDRGVAPALRMVPDGEGGIAFEWKNNTPYHVTMEIHPDGSMELMAFDNDCNLVVRNRIGAEAPV